MNIESIAIAHYMPEKEARRRANTCEGYWSALRCHVLPKWGEYEIQEITHEAIQEWVDGFEQPGAAKKAFKTLRQIIRWAIRKWQLRIWDPTQGIELKRIPTYRPRVLEAREVKETLRGFYGHELEATIVLQTALGLRPGENYAMRWDRIDFRSGAVHVFETLQEVKGTLHTYCTKTPKGDRVVYLPRFALRRLREIWRGLGKPKGRIVGALKPSQAARKIRSWCIKEHLPYTSMYNRRHTWATLAVEGGAPIESVAMMLGHSELGVCYEHYLVTNKTVCQKAQGAFESRLMVAV